jgi:hypothetical protein
MNTQETMLQADVAGENKPVTHPEETRISEICPDVLTGEVVEETSIQQAVIEQPDVTPETEDVVPEKEDVPPKTEEVIPEEDLLPPETETAVPVAETILPEEKEVVPAVEDALPEEAVIVPAAEDVMPEEAAIAPEAEDLQPDEPEVPAYNTAEEAANAEPMMTELPTTPDNFCGELQEAIEVGAVGMISKQEILDELKGLVAHAETVAREQVDKLKQSYYRTVKAETDELRKVFVENGGNEADFETPEDEDASLLKELLAEYKQKKSLLNEKDSQLKEENYAKKLQLIDRLQALVESQEDFNRRYNEFKEIQQKWKELDPVPQEQVRDLWRNYQVQSERFYDLIKINNQFRDYDFKKNLELKTSICETVEKLANEPDAISAYHQLQKLFQQWREIGPVSREHRDTLWMRFKEASTVVNRNHHSYFEALKAGEEKNLKAKTEICELVEHIDYALLKTYKDWEKKSKEVISCQKKWYSIGFATKKQNSKIFDRFRNACSQYFSRKAEFHKTLKKEFEKNHQLKRDLIAKAEELKDRTDWKEATKAVIEIQNEWKKIGPVAYKYSDLLWKQFIAACDHFFEQKSKLFHSHKTEESANLATKQLLVDKITALGTELPVNEAMTELKLLIAEWNTVGHVPFKEKDRIYKAFRTAVDKQYDRLNIAQSDRRMQQYRTTLATEAGRDRGKLHGERDKLMRTFERIKSELQTYENNVGFFNVSSKGGNNLRKEMEHKIERLKEEMALIVKKIDAIDETLE